MSICEEISGVSVLEPTHTPGIKPPHAELKCVGACVTPAKLITDVWQFSQMTTEVTVTFSVHLTDRPLGRLHTLDRGALWQRSGGTLTSAERFTWPFQM